MEAERKKDLQRVLARMWQHGLVIIEEKCQLFKPQVEFLGHLLDQTSIRLLLSRWGPSPSTPGRPCAISC